jgi:hypothetical protein
MQTCVVKRLVLVEFEQRDADTWKKEIWQGSFEFRLGTLRLWLRLDAVVMNGRLNEDGESEE